MVTEICSSSNLWIRKSELTVNIVFLQTFRRRATKNKPGWPNWQRHFCCGVFIEVVTKQKLEGEKIHLFILITCPPPKINPDYSRTCSNRSQKFTCYENRIFGSENQSQFSPASVQCPLNEVCCTYHAEPKILDSLYCRIASKMPNYFRVPITLEIWLVTIFFYQSLHYSMHHSNHVLRWPTWTFSSMNNAISAVIILRFPLAFLHEVYSEHRSQFSTASVFSIRYVQQSLGLHATASCCSSKSSSAKTRRVRRKLGTPDLPVNNNQLL